LVVSIFFRIIAVHCRNYGQEATTMLGFKQAPIVKKGFYQFSASATDRALPVLNKHQVVNDALIDDIDKYITRDLIDTNRLVKLDVFNEGIQDRQNFFSTYKNKKGNKLGLLVNLGTSVELIRKGFLNEDFLLQRLRCAGEKNGGYFRKKAQLGKKCNIKSQTYESLKVLKSFGFCDFEKVHNYRNASLYFSPIQEWVFLPYFILKSKNAYKSFILAAVESYMLRGIHKKETKGVTKFDEVKRKWVTEQYSSTSNSVREMKFKRNQSFYEGKLKDSFIVDFLNPNGTANITARTLSNWRHKARYNSYFTKNLYIPVEGKKISKKFRGNSTLFTRCSNQVMLLHSIRNITTSIPIFRIRCLVTPFLLLKHQTKQNK